MSSARYGNTSQSVEELQGLWRNSIVEAQRLMGELMAEFDEMKRREGKLRAALEEIDKWLVCHVIATPDDMAQSFEHMEGVAAAALADEKPSVDQPRCTTCGWPLVASAKEGCVPENCCMRLKPTEEKTNA